jgi:hypothetical protein
MLVTPGPPSLDLLRDTEIVDEIEGAYIALQQPLHALLSGLKGLVQVIEAADQPGSPEGFDFGPVMVCGD